MRRSISNNSFLNANNNSSFSLHAPETILKIGEHSKKKSLHSSFIQDSCTVSELLQHKSEISDKYSKLIPAKVERKQDLKR